MIFVVDAGAARQAVAGGLLRCPEEGCGGVLRPWASARARCIRVPGGGQARLRPGPGTLRGLPPHACPAPRRR